MSASTIALALGVAACLGLAAVSLPSLVAPSAEPTPIDLVFATPTATPFATPSGSLVARDSPSPSPTPLSDAPPTRVVIAGMAIDLPVVKPKPDETYPWCDVAEYLTFYSVPGLPGVTYLYAHAQKGMFLPLLDASLDADGKAMRGRLVQVYTDDDLVRTYEITEVHRHTKSFDVADAIVGDALVLQTSETAYRTGGKLTVVARPIGDPDPVATTDAHPKAKPRDCAP